MTDLDRTTLCLASLLNKNGPLIAITEQSGQGQLEHVLVFPKQDQGFNSIAVTEQLPIL